MKQVLRESLWIMALQTERSWLGERRESEQIPWTYEALQELRPKYAASSWRGAMAKAIEQGWVLRTLHEGKTAFLLTKKGETLVIDRFFPFQTIQHASGSSSQKTLVLLRRQGKPTNSSFRQKLPGVWVHALLACVPGQWYDAEWVRLAQQAGYEVCVLLVDPEKAQPFSLNDWLREENLPLQRKVFAFSKELRSMLVTLQEKKYATRKDKQRFGSLAVSGLTEFLHISPDISPGDALWKSAQECLELLLSLERLIRGDSEV